MPEKVLIVGTGLAGLASAVRLNKAGYQVTLIDQYHQAGGRLNQIKKEGYTFDYGPTFFSMSYEFDELLKDCDLEPLFEFQELNPLYNVYFRGTDKQFKLFREPDKLAKEFSEVEPDFEKKFRAYIKDSGELFNDTINKIVKRNFNSFWSYMGALVSVPPKHVPKLFRSFWTQVDKYFDSNEVKEIISLVSFFLGGTPFNTPAVYTILSYTEFVNDGYHNVKGGMYEIVNGLVNYLTKQGISFHYNVEISDFTADSKTNLSGFIDAEGKKWEADIFIVNADAALFRNKVFKRKKYNTARLMKKQWTMAPFTMYVGVQGKIPDLGQHNYFLGNNFKDYATKVYSNAFGQDKPYYYVNIPSKNNADAAPPEGEALFFLVPVPDRRSIPEWKNKEQFGDEIIADFEQITGHEIRDKIKTKTIVSPEQWESDFNLFMGSGLGLGHSLKQMAYFRPKNTDEKFNNVFYSGASTIPGTGLPMVMISAKLTVEQILKRYGSIS